MGNLNFVDLITKATELRITEATLRARLMSGDELCFIYATNVMAWATSGTWLPAYDAEQFPMVRWEDHGSEFRVEDGLTGYRQWPPNRTPRYEVTGWVGVPPRMTAQVLTRGEAPLASGRIDIFDSNFELVSELQLGEYRDIESPHTDRDGYSHARGERTAKVVTPANLFMCTGDRSSPRSLSRSSEKTYLGIIAAMRALLRDEEGGAFPSDAKIIEQLVERYSPVYGLSRRKLEDVFPASTRLVGDLTQRDKERKQYRK